MSDESSELPIRNVNQPKKSSWQWLKDLSKRNKTQQITTPSPVPSSPPEIREAPKEIITPPTVELREIPINQWQEEVTQLLQKGENVDYGEVIGKVITGGRGFPIEIHTQTIGRCNSENAINSNVNLLEELLQDDKATLRGVYHITNTTTNEHGMLLAAEYQYLNLPLYLQYGKEANKMGMRSKLSLPLHGSPEQHEVLFIAIRPTAIAGEMDIAVIGQDEEIHGYYPREVVDWKSDDTVLPSTYGETRLLTPEKWQIESSEERGYGIFRKDGIGTTTGGIIDRVLNYSKRVTITPTKTPKHRNQDHLNFFKPAIQQLRNTNFPYKPAISTAN